MRQDVLKILHDPKFQNYVNIGDGEKAANYAIKTFKNDTDSFYELFKLCYNSGLKWMIQNNFNFWDVIFGELRNYCEYYGIMVRLILDSPWIKLRLYQGDFAINYKANTVLGDFNNMLDDLEIELKKIIKNDKQISLQEFKF